MTGCTSWGVSLGSMLSDASEALACFYWSYSNVSSLSGSILPLLAFSKISIALLTFPSSISRARFNASLFLFVVALLLFVVCLKLFSLQT